MSDTDTIQSLRQGIFDSDADVGIAYLGHCEGPIGDGIINVIEGSDYVNDFAFLRRIPFDNYIETKGSDYFLILPVSNECSLAVNDEDGNVLYRSEYGEPVILMCDGSIGNARINVVNGTDGPSFYIKLENGRPVQTPGVIDISIY